MARLTKIVTKTGDGGETGLVGGARVPKDHPRIVAGGTIDELSSAIGLARSLATASGGASDDLDPQLEAIQQQLFRLGAELATPPDTARTGMPRISATEVRQLEESAGRLNAQLGPLTEFILPGGCPAGAALHLARTICRRAERECVRLRGATPVGEFVIPYLNRLGDALFIFARWANRQGGHGETLWQK